jgi:membrane complex biogenesis BtpA family protein
LTIILRDFFSWLPIVKYFGLTLSFIKINGLKLEKSIIAMVHVAALPGTPGNVLPVHEIVEKALKEAKILEHAGVDAILIENMHDRPYLNRKVGPEIIASLTAVASKLREQISVPPGIQILAGANKAALAVAQAARFDFIRAEGFVFGHLADEGWMNSDAGKLLRYRKQIGAENILIFTDIKKKHASHAASSDISIAETAKAASFFLSDGLVVTGNATGEKASLDDVKAVKNVSSLPVLIGSGIDLRNIAQYWHHADAFIVGSSLKKEGIWENDVDENKVQEFMDQIKQLRKK